MTRNVSESDWNTFRDLRETALQRFCERVLKEIDLASNDPAKTHHQRYLDIVQLIQAHDKQLALAFDNPRRSAMHRQLTLIHELGLLVPEELKALTPETRTRFESRSLGAKG